MALEILDGTIDATAPMRASGGYAIFDTLRFRDRSGAERSFKAVCTGGAVTDLLRGDLIDGDADLDVRAWCLPRLAACEEGGGSAA